MGAFKDKVLSMSAEEIILAMVEALTHPPIMNIDMRTFGEVRDIDGEKVCFGCAATNTICQISGLSPMDFLKGGTDSRQLRATNLDEDYEFLVSFENAIDDLRKASIGNYNYWASIGGFAKIQDVGVSLTYLFNGYTNEDLISFRELAEKQPQ